MKRLVVLFLAGGLFLFATGCAKSVPKLWEAAGGSRADATVTVGYSYNPIYETPKTDNNQGYQTALKRCQSWGYTDAEPFGLVSRQCTDSFFTLFGGLQCREFLITQQYQCLGKGDSAINNNSK